MRPGFGTLIVISLATCTAPVFAQGSSLSADQIIKSLTPTGDVSKVTTRGIRMAPQSGSADAAPTGTSATDVPRQASHAVMAAAKPTVAVPLQPSAAPAVNLTVNFKSGSTELTPQAMHALDALGAALSSDALSRYRFRVEGHTDTMGALDANRLLSEQRAQAVVSYVSSKFGIAASRMDPVGMGAGKQLVATGDQVAEPRNRRVQIVNLGT